LVDDSAPSCVSPLDHLTDEDEMKLKMSGPDLVCYPRAPKNPKKF